MTIPNNPVSFGGFRIDGTTNHARTKRVITGLEWHKSLAKAATAAVKHDRPIMLINALGEIRGHC